MLFDIVVFHPMDIHVIWPVLALAITHAFGSRFRFLAGIPRSVWLSIAGGVSVSYVFMHLFPELHEGQIELRQQEDTGPFRHVVYMVALAGLSVFYGLERAVVTGEREARDRSEHKGVFWTHIISFAIYNALIGYVLIARDREEIGSVALFTVAMALHFLVNDLAMIDKHKDEYIRYGRWLLVASLGVGWLVGWACEFPPEAIILMTAFIAGGVILNVLKEELPEHRKSRYWAFLTGVVLYTILWVLL